MTAVRGQTIKATRESNILKQSLQTGQKSNAQPKEHARWHAEDGNADQEPKKCNEE